MSGPHPKRDASAPSEALEGAFRDAASVGAAMRRGLDPEELDEAERARSEAAPPPPTHDPRDQKGGLWEAPPAVVHPLDSYSAFILPSLLRGQPDAYRAAATRPGVFLFSLTLFGATGSLAAALNLGFNGASFLFGAAAALMALILLVAPAHGAALFLGGSGTMAATLAVAAASGPALWPATLPYGKLLEPHVALACRYGFGSLGGGVFCWVVFRAIDHLHDIRPSGAMLAIALPYSTLALAWQAVRWLFADSHEGAHDLLGVQIAGSICAAAWAGLGLLWLSTPGWNFHRRTKTARDLAKNKPAPIKGDPWRKVRKRLR